MFRAILYITDNKTANGVLCEVTRAIYQDRIYLKSKVSWCTRLKVISFTSARDHGLPRVGVYDTDRWWAIFYADTLQIGQQIWKVRVAIYERLYVKNGFLLADFYKTHKFQAL